MPLCIYDRCIERVREPTGHCSLDAFSRRFGAFLLFLGHHELSANYAKVLRKRPHRLRIVRPNCPQAAVNGGEDNAMYKPLPVSIAHCGVEGECNNPTNCRTHFFPRLEVSRSRGLCSHELQSSRGRCPACTDAVLQSSRGAATEGPRQPHLPKPRSTRRVEVDGGQANSNAGGHDAFQSPGRADDPIRRAAG